MSDAIDNEISETLVSPGSSQLGIIPSTPAGDQMYVPDRYRSLNALCSSFAPSPPPTYPIRVFKTIASTNQGIRSESSLATYLVPKPRKRSANNFTGVTGTERCTFCMHAKKKVPIASSGVNLEYSVFSQHTIKNVIAAKRKSWLVASNEDQERIDFYDD